MRIRWRGVARMAAIVVVGLLALRLGPSLLHAPEPPPVPATVGLPKGRPAQLAPVLGKQPPRVHRRSVPDAPAIHRRPVPDAPAATAKIGTATEHRRRHHRGHRRPSPPPHDRATRAKPSHAPEPPPEPPVESAPSPPPEYVPPPVPEPAPTPVPEAPAAPPSVPGDGSEEFMPH